MPSGGAGGAAPDAQASALGLPYGQPQPPKHPSPSWVTIDRGGVHRGLSTLRFRRFRFTLPFPGEGCCGGQGGRGDGWEETGRGSRDHGIAITRFRLSRQSLPPQGLTASSSSMAASITAWNDVFVGRAFSTGCGVAGTPRPCCGSPVGPAAGVRRRSRPRRPSSAGRPGLARRTGPGRWRSAPRAAGSGLPRWRWFRPALWEAAALRRCRSRNPGYRHAAPVPRSTGGEAGQEGDAALAGRLDRGLSRDDRHREQRRDQVEHRAAGAQKLGHLLEHAGRRGGQHGTRRLPRRPGQRRAGKGHGYRSLPAG